MQTWAENKEERRAERLSTRGTCNSKMLLLPRAFPCAGMICDDFCHGVFKRLPFDLIVLSRNHIPVMINVEVRG